MTTFVDLYFPPNLPVDRDHVEAAIDAAIGHWAEVVGAGTGLAGSNLDVEIRPGANLEAVLATLGQTLKELGLSGETMIAVSEPAERITLSQLWQRVPPSRDIAER